MAHYLLRVLDGDYEEYKMVEADSAKDAVDKRDLKEGTVEVWTLRSGEPRSFVVTNESVRTVKLV